MKMAKKVFALVLTCALLCGVLCACGGEPVSKDAVYQVSVVDAQGEPYTTGVIVRFMQNGEQVALQPISEQGVAEKTLTRGDYTVELMFTDDASGFYYDTADLTLSSEKTQLQIVLTHAVSSESQSLYVQGEEYLAYYVSTGSTRVELTTEKRNYFLFAPTTAGTYAFSVDAQGTQIGCYGAPHFVQENSIAEVVNNTFTVSVRADMISSGNTGTSVFVIGIDSQSAETAMLSIERIGDPEWSVEDEPWTVYAATAKLTKYKLPEGAKTAKFDITAATDAYTLVLNETDGCYHLNTADGPLVLFNLGEKSGGGAPYLDSFQTVLDRTGINKYFFDENGEFVKKESYTECVLEYIEYMDEETGLYPLTEDLKYILQQRGDYAGWFDPNSNGYMFIDSHYNAVSGINNEIAWLCMCCYLEG